MKLEVDFVDMSNFSAGFLEAVLGYVNNTLFWRSLKSILLIQQHFFNTTAILNNMIIHTIFLLRAFIVD